MFPFGFRGSSHVIVSSVVLRDATEGFSGLLGAETENICIN